MTHTDLTIIAIIGIILLIGIVKKNAIMIIDFALAAEREEGKNSRDSIEGEDRTPSLASCGNPSFATGELARIGESD